MIYVPLDIFRDYFSIFTTYAVHKYIHLTNRQNKSFSEKSQKPLFYF